MTKIVYNACFGGFGLSEKAVMRYAEIKGFKLWAAVGKDGFKMKTYWRTQEAAEWYAENSSANFFEKRSELREQINQLYKSFHFAPRDIPRDDPALAQTVEELGKDADGSHAALRIAEVASGLRYRIDEYDGSESVMTVEDYTWEIA